MRVTLRGRDHWCDLAPCSHLSPTVRIPGQVNDLWEERSGESGSESGSGGKKVRGRTLVPFTTERLGTSVIRTLGRTRHRIGPMAARSANTILVKKLTGGIVG